jgi:hypothetical protein
MLHPIPRAKWEHQVSFGLLSSVITMVLQQSEQSSQCLPGAVGELAIISIPRDRTPQACGKLLG